MVDLEGPPIGAEQRESIEVEQYKTHLAYRAKLNEMRVVSLWHRPFIGWEAPPALPRQPIRLGQILSEYALALFESEAKVYPQTAESSPQLGALATSAETMVMKTVADMQINPLERLDYHATLDQMRSAIQDSLRNRVWENAPPKTSALIEIKPPKASSVRQFLEPKPELLSNAQTVNKTQAARALGVSVRTLDRYVADKLLTPTGGFSRRRFKTKDLLSFLNRKNRDK